MTSSNRAAPLPPLQTVRVSTPYGGKEYTLPIVFTSHDGTDLTGELIEVSLGTAGNASTSTPGTWIPSTDPRTLATYTSPDEFGESTAAISLLIDTSTAAGSYAVWARLTDHPEVLPVCLGRLLVA